MAQSSDPKMTTLAFRKLYDEHVHALYKTAYYFLKDEHLARDLVQDVFIKIYEKRHKLGSVQDFKLYFKKSVRNLAKKYIKKMARHKSKELEFARVMELSAAIHQQILGRYDFLLSVIENLPPKQREVYKLAKIEGLSYEEIGTRLSLSVNTIKHYVSRTKASLLNAVKGWKP